LMAWAWSQHWWGDDIDIAGGMFANAVLEATRQEAPSLRSVQ